MVELTEPLGSSALLVAFHSRIIAGGGAARGLGCSVRGLGCSVLGQSRAPEKSSRCRRRRFRPPDDYEGVGEDAVGLAEDPTSGFLDFYDEALPHVYGYLVRRCGSSAEAEDLCSETFLAAVDAVRGPDPPGVNVPWAIGVARHKLVDHWRRQARDERRLEALAGAGPAGPPPGELDLDALEARRVLADLIPQHRAVLTLRYLDDLPVPEVARLIGRTVHATEALLVRARGAFRSAYPTQGEGSDG